ncbi:MAG: HU family DNA-binding protein [Sedimentisphaerales bacterium]|nr:HU family DNA-binding protein [Sedimentisphaerales bacterium]
MNKIAESTNTPRTTTKRIVQCFLDEVIAELAKDNRLEFRDFGVFDVRLRAARSAQNPKTMEPVQVPPKRVVKFKIGRALKVKLNGDDTE